jgi:hypothetical protein
MDEKEKVTRFELRLPASLRQKLEKRTRESRRSLNAEIVYVLNRGLVTEGLGELREDIKRRRENLKQALYGYLPELTEMLEEARDAAAQKGMTLGEALEARIIELAEEGRSRRGELGANHISEELRKAVSEEEPE